MCTNVNAFYNDAIAVDGYGSFEANFIQMIGVRAVGSSGVCQNIRVFEDENGVCSAMRMGAPDVFPLGTSEDDGIIVRRVRNRVRISVPNCEHISLVMWITCEARSGVRSLRFDISRGLNLRPTSHGLIGKNVIHCDVKHISLNLASGETRSCTMVISDGLSMPRDGTSDDMLSSAGMECMAAANRGGL